MNTVIVTRVGCFAAALLFSAINASADEGMWLLNQPPAKVLKDRYKFEPSAAWLEHVQKSCVRFSTGGSGSIISPDGLVMTNHHIGADVLQALSTPEHNLVQEGFYAKTRAEERKAPDLELLSLWSIEDVTDRVKGAAAPGMSPADANTARRKMMSTIEQEAEKRTGLDCQVVTLYQGGLYHLYCYKRYTDVRLVMAPEDSIAFFGGDNDNFEYPRFDLDMCFFRIYENDKPLQPEHYLHWSKGAADGELTFVFGHPGRTQRLYTVDHLKFLRDVDVPMALRGLWRREVQLQSFSSRSDENARIANEDLLSVQNSRKAETGIMAGLLDPALWTAKSHDEQKLRAAVEADSEHRSQWIDAWPQLVNAEQEFRSFYLRYQLLEGRRTALRSDLFTIARHLVRLADEKPKPNADRLREYRDTELDSLYLDLFSPAPIYDALEIDRLRNGLSSLAENLGGNDHTVMQTCSGQSPEDRARALVLGTKLKDIEVRKQLAEGGKQAIAESKDPMIRLAAQMDPEARALRKRYEDQVEGAERDAYAKIAAARFAIYGKDIYPDATFTLRMAFGPIKGYQEEGKSVPPFTTLGGAYQRMQERHGVEPFKLPQRWLDRKDKLNLDTPYNFVCTADIIGGNSGSPVVNKDGELIGLIFDGNLQSLIWDVQYTDEQGRAVAVDSRAIIECLRKLYDAGALAEEIVGK